MKNADYLEAFKDYLLEEEKSPGTIDGYTGDVKHFIIFIKKDINTIQKADLMSYKDFLRSRQLKVATINRKLVGVQQFVDFINDRFSLEITAKIKQEKVQKQYSLKDDELLSEEDFQAIIKVVNTKHDMRAKALFETMYYSGMRISEALQMTIDHVGLRILEDIKGKGGKYRDIYISDKLLLTLKEYKLSRVQPFSSNTKALFVGERGPITRQTAHTMIKKYAKLAGIEEKKAHVHNLRHLFGLRLAAKGVPIEEIAEYMGHTSIEVTRIYLRKTQSYYADRINQL